MNDWDNLENVARRKSVQFYEVDWNAALVSNPLVRVGKGPPTASEQTIQRAIIKALRALGIRVKHTPNAVPFGGNDAAKIKQASRWRADGVIAGWPDIDVMKPGAPIQYGHIEIKRPGEYLSPDQVRCIAHMRADGCLVDAAASVDDAIAIVRRWRWV